MKKLFALLMVCLLCVTSASAAEWGEGLSAAQPYPGVPEVKLNETMGYIMLYPRAKMPATGFCDVLEMYLPREDIVLGEGSLTVFDADGELCKVDFDGDHVELRELEEMELEGLRWGGGVCIEMHLPVSLTIGGAYYVNMDEGCFKATEGNVTSLPIASNDAWVPVLNGDYGVSDLRYGPAPEAEEDEDEDAEPAPALPTEIKYLDEVKKGDIVSFDLLMGGDAQVAVAYSENDSVYFDTAEYTKSGRVVGVVQGDEVSWGVVFLDDSNNILTDFAWGADLSAASEE